MTTLIYWADGKINDAVACTSEADAAKLLGIEEHELNSCTPGQAGSYNLSLRDDTFQNAYGDSITIPGVDSDGNQI